MGDVVVVSLHDKGFWQADFYRGASEWDNFDWTNGNAPDGFFTLKRDQTMEDAFAKAREKWPGAVILEGAALGEDELQEDCFAE
jgi:hypothetical protein